MTRNDENRDAEGQRQVAASAVIELPTTSRTKRSANGHRGIALSANVRKPEALRTDDGSGPPLRADQARNTLPDPSSLAQLAELQVRRKFYISVVNKQTNALKALVRRATGWRYDVEDGDRDKINRHAAKIVAAALAGKPQAADDTAVFAAIGPDLEVVASAIEPCQKARAAVEKDMKRIAQSLPVYPWAKSVRGFGDLGLAVIIAEAGDLSGYPKKGHLWKRLGLAPHEGKACSTWRRTGGLSADDWTALGYSPRRRAEVFAVISEPLIRQQTMVAGPYRAIYVRRKAATAEAHADWTKMHAHMDALRVMTKYLLRDLWREWNRGEVGYHLPKTAISLVPTRDTGEREATQGLPTTAVAHVPPAHPLAVR